MGLSMKQMVLLAGLQTAKGTPATLTGAKAILAKGIEPGIIDGNLLDRGIIQPSRGNGGRIFTSPYRKQKLTLDFAGSGTAGTAPAWSELLQACAFAVTTVPGTSVVFDPISVGQKYLTLQAMIEKTRFATNDAQGKLSFKLDAGSIPEMTLEFIGEYVAPDDLAALPAGIDYSLFKDPVPVGRINTASATLFGYSPCIKTLSIDMADEQSYRDLINCGGVSTTDRKPTLSAQIELTTATDKNWAELIRANATGAFSFVHGKTGGNILQIDAPKVQITSATLADDAGVAMLNIQADLLRNSGAGNDEIRITCK